MNTEDRITSPIGTSVANALNAREKMQIATENAMDATLAMGIQIGIDEERQRIIEWVEANRRKLELDDDVFIYRDSFNSEDLIRVINGEKID